VIKIDFEFQTSHGLTDDQIEAMKLDRVDNWIAVVTAPLVEKTPAEV